MQGNAHYLLLGARLIMLCLFFGISSFSYGQNTLGIHGYVSDSTGTAIETGNIILLSPEDSSVVKGTNFWEGEFQLMGIESTHFLLKITAQGFQTYLEEKNLNPTDSLAELDTIVLSASVQSLEEVSIVAHKPMFQRELDRLVVNVEGTILSEKGSVIDLLRSAPNVIVRSSGAVEVVGKGAAIIYLDGRRINSLETLNALQANDIARIEVVDNPSSKYDAAGNAVIEIFTKNGVSNGYEGQVGVRAMFRTEQQMAYWASFGLRKNWFSMRLSAYQYAGTLHEEEQYHRKVFSSPLITMENSVSRAIEHNFDTGYNLDMDFRINKNNTVFVDYNGSRRQLKPHALNNNLIYEDSVSVGTLESDSKGIETKWTHSIATGYELKLDTLGSKFSISGQYTNFSGKNTYDITQTTNYGTPIEQYYRNQNANDIGVYTAKSDLTKKWSDKIEFNTGIKYSSIGNSSNVDLKEQVNESYVTDSSTYNWFEYRESIAAAYTEIRGKLNKFHYLAGVRYEGTNMQGSSYLSGTGVINRTYHNLFPTVQLSYHFTKDLVLGMTYNYRISRPSFQDMDPFVIFVDSLTSFRGNPQLVPSYAHNAELSLIYMEYASIKLGYQYNVNPMFLSVVKDDATNQFSAITKNIQSSEMYTIALVVPWENKWWTTFNSFGYYVNDYRYANNQQIIASTKPTWYISLYDEFRIPKWFDIELNYEYYSPGSQGFFIAKPYQFLMATISRKFFDKKLSVNISYFDPFKWSIERASAELYDFYVDYSSWMDSRSLMFTIRYNFGKLTNNQMVGKDIDRDSQNRIKN